MEQMQALKHSESSLSLVADHVSVLSSKLEDLLFRAQRIGHALKSDLAVPDMMFGYDLQNFRRDVRSFSNELGSLSSMLAQIERTAQFDESCVTRAQAVMRLADRLHKALVALHGEALLAHEHIRQADHKVEAWYLVQETEALAQRTQGLPTVANKIVIQVSTPQPDAPAPDARPAPPPPAPDQPKG